MEKNDYNQLNEVMKKLDEANKRIEELEGLLTLADEFTTNTDKDLIIKQLEEDVESLKQHYTDEMILMKEIHEEEVDKLNQQIDGLQETLTLQSKASSQQIAKERYTATQNVKESSQNMLKELQKVREQKDGVIASLKDKVKVFEDENKSLKDELNSKIEEANIAKQKLEEAKQNVGVATASNTEGLSQEKLAKVAQYYKNKVNVEKQAEISALQSKYDKAKTQIQQLNKAYQESLQRYETLDKATLSIEEADNWVKTQADKYEAEIARLNGIIAEKDIIIAKKDEELADANKKLDDDEIRVVYRIFGVTEGNSEAQALYKAVRKSMSKKTYDDKVEEVRKALVESRNHSTSKVEVNVTTDEAIEAINRAMERPSIRKALTRSKKMVLGFVSGVVLAAGVFAFLMTSSILTNDKNKTLSNDNNNLTQENTTLRDISELQASYGTTVGIIKTGAQTVSENMGYATQLKTLNDGEAPKAKMSARSEESTFDQAYKSVSTAKDTVDKVVVMNENGEIVGGEVLTSISNYETAVQENNKEDANAFFNEVSEFSAQVSDAQSTSTTGVQTLLNELGLTVDQVNQVNDLIKNPLAMIEFSEADIKTYNSLLVSSESGFGGAAKNIISASYTKATGEVNILTECEDLQGRAYLNNLTYTLPAQLAVVPDVKTLFSGANNGTSVAVYSGATLGAEDLNNSDYRISITKSYKKATDKTTITGKMIVFVRDEKGNITNTKSIKDVTITVQGKVNDLKEYESEIAEKLLEKAAQQGITVNLTYPPVENE